MKTDRAPRRDDSNDELRKAKRLAPRNKSGKERHALYASLDDDDEEDDYYLPSRESALDYFDDESEIEDDEDGENDEDDGR